MRIRTAFFLITYALLTQLQAQTDEIVFKSKPESLGDSVNTIYTEAEPRISPDGKMLYFCKRTNPYNVGGNKDKADIWYSELNTSGEWKQAKNIGRPVNNQNFNQLIGIRSDGNAMLITGKYAGYASTSGNVFISYKTAGGWGIPRPVEIDGLNIKELNYLPSYTVSVDFQVLILSLYFKNSKKASDLYVSFREGKYKWSTPKRMGDVINSAKDEVYPVLANDGATLYFSSEGFGGYGNFDIFVSRRQSDDWTDWSKPKNLGNIINTEGFDSDFVVATKGDYAYISSNVVNDRGFDIYRIELPEEAKPNPVVLVYGKIYDSKTNKPIQAEVAYHRLSDGKSIGKVNSDIKTGEYKIVLPYGEKYGFTAQADGYLAVSENLDITDTDIYKELEKNLMLVPFEIGATVRMNNLFFDTGESTLNKESYPELDQVVELLKANPKMEIEIAGHTDDVGSNTANQQLSEARAKFVTDYIVKQGINKARIQYKGYGETKPVVANNSDENRQKNRRVEFKILKK